MIKSVLSERDKMEVWRDVVGYEGLYMVSDMGNVAGLRFGFKIKKQNIGTDGKNIVYLRKDGKGKTVVVHKLVAIAFLGHVPCGYKVVVDHIDNDPLNNKLQNLQLITARENSSKDRVGGSSKYTGVVKTYNGKYIAKIKINKDNIYLGTFTYEIDAHNAYQDKLKTII
jgi:hypothetical protein